MILKRCRKCSETFLVPRARCPRCLGEEFSDVTVKDAVVSECLEIIATPEPYPEKYFLILAKTDGGVTVFCRSDQKIGEGSAVIIDDSELGPVCSRS